MVQYVCILWILGANLFTPPVKIGSESENNGLISDYIIPISPKKLLGILIRFSKEHQKLSIEFDEKLKVRKTIKCILSRMVLILPCAVNGKLDRGEEQKIILLFALQSN
ncbi:hypothetical protein ETB55_18645 [Salmonella enterica subsp. enterica serovar Omuna]|nr:hypothetical protein [Salmonella enterica subsp. enterica serovar Omuna]